MLNNFFSNVTSDIYIRKYVLDPEFTNDLQIYVYAECSPNIDRESEDEGYYLLELYFSVGGDPTRDYIWGIPFGTKEMDRQRMDVEMDHWVTVLEDDESFFLQIEEYRRKAKLWEDILNRELGGMDNAEQQGE